MASTNTRPPSIPAAMPPLPPMFTGSLPGTAAPTGTPSPVPGVRFAGYQSALASPDGIPALFPQNFKEVLLANNGEMIFGFKPNFLPMDSVLSKGKKVSASSTFVKKMNYLIVPFDDGSGGKFYYYPVKTVQHSASLYRFVTLPAIMREGFFVTGHPDRKIIFVTIEDLKRRVIRVSRELPDVKPSATYDDFINGTYKKHKPGKTAKSFLFGDDSNGRDSSETGDRLPGETGRGSDLSSGELSDTIPGLTLEELSSIDMAFEEQVASLLGATAL